MYAIYFIQIAYDASLALRGSSPFVPRDAVKVTRHLWLAAHRLFRPDGPGLSARTGYETAQNDPSHIYDDENPV